ncbi:IQ motif containing G (Silurana), partial [Caligus rogercresseyi]
MGETCLRSLHADWTRRSLEDVLSKQEELLKLKGDRDEDSRRFMEAKNRLKEIGEFVERDRLVVERARIEKERYVLEIRAAIRIQH